MLHSARVFGVSDLELHKSRAIASDLLGLTKGQSRTMALLLVPGREKVDPLFQATCDLTFAYHSIVWDRKKSMDVLFRVWPAVCDKLISSPRPWTRVHGPMSAAFISFLRVGWHMLSPVEVVSDKGSTFHLMVVPPKVIIELVTDSVYSALWKNVVLHFPMLACVIDPWFEPLIKYMLSKHKSTTQPIVVAIASKGYWTKAGLREIDRSDGLCEHCGVLDDMAHRTMEGNGTGKSRLLFCRKASSCYLPKCVGSSSSSSGPHSYLQCYDRGAGSITAQGAQEPNAETRPLHRHLFYPIVVVEGMSCGVVFGNIKALREYGLLQEGVVCQVIGNKYSVARKVAAPKIEHQPVASDHGSETCWMMKEEVGSLQNELLDQKRELSGHCFAMSALQNIAITNIIFATAKKKSNNSAKKSKRLGLRCRMGLILASIRCEERTHKKSQ